MLTAERLREIERDGLAIGEGLTELLKMARRYLWLRDAPTAVSTGCLDVTVWGEETGEAVRGVHLDTAIDQAIAGERE